MRQKVMFKHCDPAGIVFFPRYFGMLNDCVELFFEADLGHPFETLHTTHAVPTARIDAVFSAPSRHGDVLEIALSVARVGRSSADLRFTVHCGHEPRLTADSTLVFVTAAGRPEAWPPDLREALQTHLEGGA